MNSEKKDIKMTPKALYDFITEAMPAEEALLKLLEGTLLQYEKLKFDDGHAVHPLLIIAHAAMDMGWVMAVEKEEEVRGIAVGTDEYMHKLFSKDEAEA